MAFTAMAQQGVDTFEVSIDSMAPEVTVEENAGSPTQTKTDWAAVGDDTVAVREARYDSSAIAELQANPEYDYDRSLHVENLLWDRLMRWLQQLLRKIFGSEAGSWVFTNLHWAILITALVFLLFLLRKRLFHNVLTPEAGTPRQVTAMEEDIEKLDLDRLLAKAEGDGDWRTALRYQYLKVLRRLIDEGRIHWQPRYTDREYLDQLKDPAMRASFSGISFLFKWAWYGNAPMDEARYRRLAPEFIELHSPQGR
ncbi:MAG: DUF4129 domain-containing protein [Flavobacteriales bacterium]|nr:DUF4129 domain-containing protein [Flavobacteriales bacterium]